MVEKVTVQNKIAHIRKWQHTICGQEKSTLGVYETMHPDTVLFAILQSHWKLARNLNILYYVLMNVAAFQLRHSKMGTKTLYNVNHWACQYGYADILKYQIKPVIGDILVTQNYATLTNTKHILHNSAQFLHRRQHLKKYYLNLYSKQTF